jgi:hypothetical protein
MGSEFCACGTEVLAEIYTLLLLLIFSSMLCLPDIDNFHPASQRSVFNLAHPIEKLILHRQSIWEIDIPSSTRSSPPGIPCSLCLVQDRHPF